MGISTVKAVTGPMGLIRLFQSMSGRARVVGAVMIVGGGVILFWDSPGRPEGTVHLPSLTAWGKIFSLLLLAALGVAYLVWRRPIDRARAILETSPLGGGEESASLVDWGLYVKVLLGLELVGLLGIGAFRLNGFVLSGLDTMGVLGCGAIVAFVVHLLVLARRGGPGE